MPRPSLGELSSLIFRVANITFGGGYITMAALKRELADDRKWISESDYALSFALARITPGTNIIAFCAGVGWVIRGIPGSIASVIAVTVPSSVIALLFMLMFDSWQHNRYLAGGLAAALAAACGMTWAVVRSILQPLLGGTERTIRGLLIAGTAFAASWFLRWTPVPIILGAAAIGFLWQDPKGQAK
jgi:chromate transporter